MRDIRLGDDIDDFCIRCKRVMNHAVVSVINGAAAKVRCRTCHSDHDYRHEQPPPPKVDPRKQGLFNEVLKKIDPSATPVNGEEPEHLEIAESAVESEVLDESEVVGEADAEGESEASAAAAAEDSKPKGRGKKKS